MYNTLLVTVYITYYILVFYEIYFFVFFNFSSKSLNINDLEQMPRSQKLCTNRCSLHAKRYENYAAVQSQNTVTRKISPENQAKKQ